MEKIGEAFASNCDLVGKVVFLTGAGGGLGQCLVDAFLSAGVKRIIAANRRPLTWQHSAVEPSVLDITDLRSVRAVAEKYALDTDILVNNAGSNHNASILRPADTEPARQEMEVNYFGTINMVREFGEVMRSRGSGTIVNIVSIGSQIAFPNMGSYCASKAAQHLMTQTIRAELKRSGVNVMGVYPPAIDTRMSTHVDASRKVSPQQVAIELTEALKNGGLEDVYIGPAAVLHERLMKEPKAVEAELGQRFA
jgi:NAD(P)-dependent dehydrogenase (short-subunit alcohol dehydrogenase family)